MSSRLGKEILRMLGVLAGTTILALSLTIFLVPNKIAPGGVSGLATVIYHVSSLSVGFTMLLINVPLFIIGIKRLGFIFGLRSLVATIYLSVAVDILQRYVRPVTDDPLLAALYGGIIMGIGLGIAISNGGTTGGTDLAAVLVHKYLRLSVGTTLLLIDAVVIVIAGFFFSLELAMYSALALF
ncbi:MAG: YitT family protein, partial [Bacillota bacterium]